MKYRAEIDGLRALAVLPVILFHAGFEWFSGGFVGVDVFFVISGYLITTIILSEMSEGKFSIVNFYERRARRILPALFFVMAVCLPFAWLWLTPTDLKGFGHSLVAVSTFSSNILFWWEHGYFGIAAELKPLLHTWSLAVEEQYYILFPVFLLLTWRLGIKTILILLSIFLLISLSIAVWGTQHAHPRIISGAFFLLPTRGWELLIGVFAAFYLKYNSHLKSHTINQMLSLLGFGMIFYSIISFDKTTPFPSLYALIPTIGTVLLILCAVPKTFVYRFLSLKYIVSIGLISYSAYLWHQPLLAFTRHRLLGDVSDLVLVSLCLASLVMAWFSWRFVERPFRSRTGFSRNFIFRFSIAGMLIFSLIGIYISLNNGFLNSLSDEEQRIYSYKNYDGPSVYREGICFLKPDQTANNFNDECFSGENLIWGDSHAAALSIGLRDIDNFSQLTASSCPPVINQKFRYRPHCLDINNRVLEYVKEGLFKTIYIHSYWLQYDLNEINNLQLTVDELLLINPSLQIRIIGGVPLWHTTLPNTLLKKGITSFASSDDYMLANYEILRVEERDNAVIDLLGTHKNRDNVKFISLIDKFCKDQECISLVANCDHAVPVAWDYGHMTAAGSKFAARLIFNKGNLVTSKCSE